MQLERVKRRYCEVPRIPMRSTVSGSVIFVTEHFFLSQTSAKTGARRRILTTASSHCADCYPQRVRATKKRRQASKGARGEPLPSPPRTPSRSRQPNSHADRENSRNQSGTDRFRRRTGETNPFPLAVAALRATSRTITWNVRETGKDPNERRRRVGRYGEVGEEVMLFV